MIHRTQKEGSGETIQTLKLDRNKVDQPLTHERHESALIGTTLNESELGIAEQPYRSETFFK